MRPRGEIRQALVSTYSLLGPLSFHEAAAHANVGFDAAVWTGKNMVRSGELVKCGVHKPPGAPNWIGIYELAPEREAEPADAALNDLAAATASWATFV